MSSAPARRLTGMTSSTVAPATINNIGVVMFTVADQDAALAFYTEKLGFEVRGDSRFGENNEHRWLEVAPPGSTARLALNPAMGGGQQSSAMIASLGFSPSIRHGLSFRCRTARLCSAQRSVRARRFSPLEAQTSSDACGTSARSRSRTR